MITKCYFIENSDSAMRAVDYLANVIPCFIRELFVTTADFATVTIECRTEDVVTVERVLAPYV